MTTPFRRARSRVGQFFMVIATLWLAGCAGREASDLSILNTRWYLRTFADARGAHEIPTDPIPFLDVTEDGLIFDNGCNEIHAPAQVDEEGLDVEMIIMRGIGCGERISDAALHLETVMADAMGSWSAYKIEGDELIFPFQGGQARFSRVLPANEYDLRSFPLQQHNPVIPDYADDELLRGQIIQEDGCLRLSIPNYYFESGFLLVWPAVYAVGFDEEGVGTFDLQTMERVAGVGDEVAISGGRIDEEIDPLLDNEWLLLSSFVGDCAGPYWIVGDVLSLEE